MPFPFQRLRRLRRTESLRRMVRETHLRPEDFIQPFFVVSGEGIENPIRSMPGQSQLSIDKLVEKSREAYELGVLGVILFGIPDNKDEAGTEAYAEEGIIQRAVRALVKEVPGLTVITDVCMCEYTSHGHCGVIKDGDVDNDPSLDLLAASALSHVRAGAHMVAPSDMMDGRVLAIRAALDENGFSHIPIMAYSAKFASAFYGPFRDAADSAPQFGDRRSYQMDPPNQREAMLEMLLDEVEGADILMVKPALPYLDILSRARQSILQPLAAYHVSGEYAMIKAAAEKGWIDERRVALESLLSIKRAGANMILTYYAMEASRWLKEEEAS